MKYIVLPLAAILAVGGLLAHASTHPTRPDSRPTTPRVDGEPSRQKASPAELRWAGPSTRNATTARVDFPVVDVKRLREVHARNRREADKPLQIGLARSGREAARNVRPPLAWVPTPHGGATARLEVRSPDASGLRVGLRLLAWDRRMELRFAGAMQPDRVVGRVDGAEAQRLSNGEHVFWTPATEGAVQFIEIHAPAGVPRVAVPVEVAGVSHLLTSAGKAFKYDPSIGRSGTCNFNTACRVGELGQAFVNAKNAVAQMVFMQGGGTYLCTGTLLADTVSANQVPYFHTAKHCIPDQAAASTLETYWNVEATACVSYTATPYTQLIGGSTLLRIEEEGDGALLRLNRAPPAGSFFSGWDAAAMTAGTGVFAIHHPSGDLKKISEGKHMAVEGVEHVVGWLKGTTEGGSSGSGLFTRSASAWHLRGGLYGGYASCATTGRMTDTNNRDFYSRFDLLYPLVANYLAPADGQAPPTPDFSVVTDRGTASFTNASTDFFGITGYQWSFGDGSTSTAAHPFKSYANGGAYNVTLTVTNALGTRRSVTRVVQVPLRSRLPVTGLTASAGGSLHYRVWVPNGAVRLRITTSGGTGNADLYASLMTVPSPDNAQYRSTGPTNTESLLIAAPGNPYYDITVHAKTAFSGLTLNTSYEGGDIPPKIIVEPLREDEQNDSTIPRQARIRLSTPYQTPITVKVTTVDGTAKAGVDYRPAELQFDMFGEDAFIFPIYLLASPEIEPEEYLTVKVTATIAGVAVVSTGTVTIVDHDGLRTQRDFDGDYRGDVLWRNSATGAMDVWHSARADRRRSLPAVGVDWHLVAARQLEGPAPPEFVWHNRRTGAGQVWINANPTTRRDLPTEPNVQWQATDLVDYGNNLALFWRDPATGKSAIWSGFNRYDARACVTMDPKLWDYAGSAALVYDHEESLWHNKVTGEVKRSRDNYLSGTLGTVSDTRWKIVAIADFGGNGRKDVLWRNMETGANAIWHDGDYPRVSLATVSDMAWIVAAVDDYDNDGRADILWRNTVNGNNDLWYAGSVSRRVALARVADQNWKVVR